MSGSAPISDARVLLLSYAFPPIALPEAYLAAKTMGRIPGVAVDVVASRPWGATRSERSIFSWRDQSLDEYVQRHFARVERVDQPPLVRAFPMHRVPVLGAVPDVLRFSNGRALRAARALEPAGYDAFVTWSQWHSVHLTGLALKRRNSSIRWVAHFSDPWVDNTYSAYRGLTRFINSRLEREVVYAADRLVFTNELTMRRFFEKYPASLHAKGAVVPHPFDSELYPGDVVAEPNVLRYVGQFYGRRTPEPLFRALRNLAEDDDSLLRGLRVEFVGGVAAHLLNSDSYRSLPPGLIRVVPAVDYRVSLALMATAAGLIVIDAADTESVFLPSKLVDYLGARRPILGITPPGTAAEVLRRLSYPTADPKSPDAIAVALRSMLDNLRACGGKDWGDDEVRRNFEAPRVGQMMRSLLVA